MRVVIDWSVMGQGRGKRESKKFGFDWGLNLIFIYYRFVICLYISLVCFVCFLVLVLGWLLVHGVIYGAHTWICFFSAISVLISCLSIYIYLFTIIFVLPFQFDEITWQEVLLVNNSSIKVSPDL